MRKCILFLLVLCLAVAFSAPASCGEKKIVLTSLEWPPYSGADLPGGGMSSVVVRAAFEAMGYEVEIRFLPWKRALEDVGQVPDVAGVFPDYAAPERESAFLLSDVIGTSAVGLVHLKSRPLHWATLQDLSGLSIGTVRGYTNTDDFDRMVNRGELHVEPAVSDLFNLRKVLAGRLALAVADVNLYQYMVLHDRRLWQDRHRLQVNPRLLGVNTLHVCFLKGEEGERRCRDFNEGLSRLNVAEMGYRYLERVFPKVQWQGAALNEKGLPERRGAPLLSYAGPVYRK